MDIKNRLEIVRECAMACLNSASNAVQVASEIPGPLCDEDGVFSSITEIEIEWIDTAVEQCKEALKACRQAAEDWKDASTSEALNLLRTARDGPFGLGNRRYPTAHEAAVTITKHLGDLDISSINDDRPFEWCEDTDPATVPDISYQWGMNLQATIYSLATHSLDELSATIEIEHANALPNAETESSKPETAGRKPGINARMLDTLQKKPECRGWTVARWAGYLKCSKSSIHATEAWKQLMDSRRSHAGEHASSHWRGRVPQPVRTRP